MNASRAGYHRFNCDAQVVELSGSLPVSVATDGTDAASPGCE